MGKKKITYYVHYMWDKIHLPNKINYKEYRKLKNEYNHYIETKEVKYNKTIIKALEIIE